MNTKIFKSTVCSLLLGSVIATTGCVTVPLNPQAKKVMILNSSALPKSCKLIEQIESSVKNFPGPGMGGEDLYNTLKNEAVALNGNVVVMESTAYDYVGHIKSISTVYYCPEFDRGPKKAEEKRSKLPQGSV